METNFSLSIDELVVLLDTHFVLFNDKEIHLPKKLADILELPEISKDVIEIREKLLPFRIVYFHQKQYNLIPR